MKTQHLHFTFCLLIATEFIAPVFLQSIQTRHYRPLPSKCDRYGRCSAKEGYIEEVDQVDDYKSDKDRPVEVSRDDWPVRTGVDNDKKVDVDKNEKSGGVRPVGGGGYGGGYNPKPVVDEDPKTSGGVRHGGGSEGYGGGYNPKPTGGRDEDLKTTGGGRPSGGSGGYGGNYKPVDRDEDLKTTGGGRPSGESGGYGGNYKPVDRDEDLKTTGGGRPSGGSGGYGGNYKPVDRDEDLKTTGGGRPSGGSGGYGGNYKPVDRDEIKPSRPSGGGGYGGGYDPKPVVDRDEYDIKPGGGYVTKPGGNRGGGGYIPKPNDDYSIKPASGGDGYGDDRKPIKDDFGGYDKSKYDYNDYGIKDDGKGSDYDLDAKPIPVIEGNCICVPYYQCQEGHIVTDGAGIIDARKRPQPDDDLPLDGKFKPPSCGPYHVCCNTPESSTVKPYEHRCGTRNPSGINSRILSPSNKGEADFGEWPWQAAVLKSEGKVNIFQCGGVLIDKYHVITVAHCVFHLYHLNEYPLKVRLGEWDTQTTNEFLAHEDYKVSKIIIHPEFRNTSLWNDIAILRLQDPVLFAPHIDTVCLPQYDEVFAGQNCVVTGWGKDAYKGGTFSNVMKEVALQVIDNYKCEEMLRKTRLGRFFQLHEGFLCAGGDYGIDSCKGDGGGPLVCYRKDKSYALAGIVSWGIDCGQPEVPGVYVKIQKYLDWISKTTDVSLQDYWPKH